MSQAERIAALSPEQRELLMHRLRERTSPASLTSPLVPELPRLSEGPVDRFAPVPLTDFQEALWLGRSGVFDLGGCGSNVYIEHEIQGPVWPLATRLNKALRAICARHELLRAIIRPDGRLQLLVEVPPYEVQVVDLRDRSDAWIEERLRQVRDEMRYARRPLDRWPLFDIVVHQINGGRARLHARFEAILIDGTARALLIQELVQLVSLPDREFPPLEVSFLDHARALADFRSTATYARSRAYWLSRLPTLPAPPVLPLARPLAPDMLPRIVKRQPEMLDSRIWQELRRRTRQAGLSPTTLLTATFAEVLRLWSARPDFTLGCGGSYRPDIHPQMVRTVGNFTTLHLLAAHDGPGTFLERTRRLQARIIADLDHQEFSGHQVWRAYNRLHRTGARALLPIHFNSVVEYGRQTAPAQSAPTPEEPPQLNFQEIELMLSLPQTLILWVAAETNRGGLELVSQAVEEVFPEDFIPSLIETYRDLLTRLASGISAWNEERPARPVGIWDVPEPWLADLAGTLSYGAHPRFVEGALERHPDVRRAAVAWHEDGEGPGRWVSWIVPREGRRASDETLRRHLRTALPEHLIPAVFVRLERLPLAADGTLDRAALFAPPASVSGEWGEIEAELAALWEEVLGRRPATLSDDFFALGGDSTSAVRLLARIAGRWGGRVPPGELFARTTLAEVAATVCRYRLADPLNKALRTPTKRASMIDETVARTLPSTPRPQEKRAQVVYFHPPVRPFFSSCSVVNHYLNEALESVGYQVNGVYGDMMSRNPAPPDVYVPLQAVGRILQARDLPPASLAVHCDFGLHLSPVRRRKAQKNVVLFHGLAGAPSQWAGNPRVDRYWGNSLYMHDVLQSVLALPSWGQRQLLEPRAFSIVSHLTLALPCLEEPEGALETGSPELSRSAREAMEQGDVLGHAVTAEKIDEPAFYSIVLRLNRLAQERGLTRRFRVFVAERMFRRIQAAFDQPADPHSADIVDFRDGLRALGLTASDVLISIPLLRQSVLFEILRACRFGLFYNSIPESFGLYALESVFHGCPIYTNGIGNLRYLLPEGCGIHVHENENMGFGDPAAYEPVAETIYRDTVTEPVGTAQRCRRGADLIRRRYNRESFRRDVAAELDRLAAKPKTFERDSLTVRLSPLVRSWNPATRRALTDHSPRQLSESERDVTEMALSRPCGEVRRSLARQDLETFRWLFQIGILALGHPDYSISEEALRGNREPGPNS